MLNVSFQKCIAPSWELFPNTNSMWESLMFVMKLLRSKATQTQSLYVVLIWYWQGGDLNQVLRLLPFRLVSSSSSNKKKRVWVNRFGWLGVLNQWKTAWKKAFRIWEKVAMYQTTWPITFPHVIYIVTLNLILRIIRH